MATKTDAEIIRASEPTGDLDELLFPDPYRDWIKQEGVRLIEDFAFEDLKAVELGPWERKGGRGAVIIIPNEPLPNDAHLVEIKPGGKSEPERHLYEEMVYVLSGRGATSMWIDENQKHTFEWKAGSLFGVPMNVNYQHFNGSGTEPAKYITVTDAPPKMRLFGTDFIFNSNYETPAGLFNIDELSNGSGKLFKRRVWQSNFIPNAPDMPLYSWSARGAGGINVMIEMLGNSMKPHISEFPVGTYKKGHRHGPGAHLLLLSGDAGYSLLWNNEDRSDMRKCDWKLGAMVTIPAEGTYHQHFNSGATRARYLALKPGNFGMVAPFSGTRKSDVSLKEGGIQIEYEDEDREIHEIFEAELAKHGATCRMKAFIPYCTGEVGPTSERDT